MNKVEAFKRLEATAREINPRLPYDVGGRQITLSFSREGAYAQMTAPRFPRPFTTRADVSIPLPGPA